VFFFLNIGTNLKFSNESKFICFPFFNFATFFQTFNFHFRKMQYMTRQSLPDFPPIQERLEEEEMIEGLRPLLNSGLEDFDSTMRSDQKKLLLKKSGNGTKSYIQAFFMMIFVLLSNGFSLLRIIISNVLKTVFVVWLQIYVMIQINRWFEARILENDNGKEELVIGNIINFTHVF